MRATLIVLSYLAAGAGFAMAAVSFLDGWLRDSGFAYDFHSYYLAGQRYLAGEPLYAPVEINDPGAYRYLPTFAALIAPFTVLPELVLTWLYRAACFICLRYLMGSWRAVGWALLFPPVLIELSSLNVTLPLAAGARWALRGSGAAAVPAGTVLKYSAVLLMPYLWLTRRASRRPLLVGTLMTAATVAAHAALDPEAWRLFAVSLLQQSESANDAPHVGEQLMFLVPSTLGDFLVRLAGGSVLLGIAVWRRWDWLAFVAVVIAVPTLWVARLAPLVAVPRMFAEDRVRGEARDRPRCSGNHALA